ncbi:MAG: lamin tail domain-containing protein [Candidatus Marinimicrobia bacterium]|nr:lamin tail domain-containing protein [Candidatus Neomarinimicrobiota bacterium]
MKKGIVIGLLFSCIFASSARIMTYNLLNYEDENDREDDFIAIINVIEPNLIIAEEVQGQSGFSHFKSDVLDITHPNMWTGATFTNQSASQDIALYYQHNLFTFISTSTINTAQSSGTRDVVEWIMMHNDSGIEFRVYGVHLKASSGDENAQQRLAEVTILRDYLNTLPAEIDFIVAGDFNIYSHSPTSEPAFDMLTGDSGDNNGRLFDPIDRIGYWHNNSSYSDVHTQSPRGGNFGGMDDRFDWLFTSEVLLDDEADMHYISNTYWAFGNDGNHFNQSINDGNNTSVNDAIADALYNASDHLPVYMDVWFDDLVYSDVGIIITEIMPNPSKVSDSYGEWFEIHNASEDIVDLNGWHIKDNDNDDHTITTDNSTLLIQPGQYLVFCRNSDFDLNGGVVSDYDYDGFSLSNNADEAILTDEQGAIVDEVNYTSSFAYGSGYSMEIHDLDSDNNIEDNWYSATSAYGLGDLGTPGRSWDDLSISDKETFPESFHIFNPYPNPFNPTTNIWLTINQKSNVEISIFNIAGEKTASIYRGSLSQGSHKFKWDASTFSSGVYFVYYNIQGIVLSKKLVLIK